MSKKIRFMPMSKDVEASFVAPSTAKSQVPEWYKKSQLYTNGKRDFSRFGINKDLKLCIPFLDAMTSGYTIELPCDVEVIRNDKGFNFFWQTENHPISLRKDEVAKELPRPAGHAKQLQAWVIHWATITPPGYSAIFCHPFNRYDLPFTTTAGIVDTDSYSMGGEVPFFLSSSFSGTIPAGTPIMQVFPFKRESWESETLKHDQAFISRLSSKVTRVFSGGYAKLFWKKKSYR